jgi:hypothetical protein
MSAALPNGYVTILEAAGLLSRAIYAGVPDLSAVSRLRKAGLSVRNGRAGPSPRLGASEYCSILRRLRVEGRFLGPDVVSRVSVETIP